MSSILLKPPAFPSASSFSKFRHRHLFFPTLRNAKLLPLRLPITILSSNKYPSNPKTSFKTHSLSHTIQFLKPYVLSEHKTIILGWICSAISVFSLSKIVSLVGKIPATINSIDTIRLKSEGLVLGCLVVARLVATYGQQALLWNAALKAVYKLRLHVFDRLLERELGFFEGKDGLSSGDIAYRITAEASNVADTLYAVFNVGNRKSFEDL